jgi:hypothetical protein
MMIPSASATGATIPERLDHAALSRGEVTIRRVTLLVAAAHDEPEFTTARVADVGVFPHVLDADNLRTAAALAKRLDADEHGNAPVPLLRIHATNDLDSRTNPHGIVFPCTPRLLASLIADAVRAEVASGAVVLVPGHPRWHQELQVEIAHHLHRAGFHVTTEIPGWRLEVARLASAV